MPTQRQDYQPTSLGSGDQGRQRSKTSCSRDRKLHARSTTKNRYPPNPTQGVWLWG